MNNPEDTLGRKTGARGRQLLHATINVDHWDYKEETGNDVGRDCILELSENDLWLNHKIEGQIKGTTVPNYILDNKYISIPIDVKTLRYALGSHAAFVLFVVDVNKKTVYYQCLQDYFIEDKNLLKKLETEQKTLNVRVPVKNVLNDDDKGLQELAKRTYLGGVSEKLHYVVE